MIKNISITLQDILSQTCFLRVAQVILTIVSAVIMAQRTDPTGIIRKIQPEIIKELANFLNHIDIVKQKLNSIKRES